MIVFVIVPPDADMFNQRFMYDFHHDDQPRTIYIVPDAQVWFEERPWSETIEYEEYDLRRIRQTILDEFEDEDIHVVTRYDVALYRRLPRIKRLSACTFNDVATMCDWIKSADYAHGSISERVGNQQVNGNEKLVAAPTLLNFYRPRFLHEIDYNFLKAPETLIDRDLTLALLQGVYENVVNYEFACRGTVDKLPAVDDEDAFLLERRHEGFVEAVISPGTWNTVCQWRQAYDSGR